jgi:hypothetical protein
MINIGDLVYIPSHVRLDYHSRSPRSAVVDWHVLAEPRHFLVTDISNQKLSILYEGQIWQVKEKDVYPIRKTGSD